MKKEEEVTMVILAVVVPVMHVWSVAIMSMKLHAVNVVHARKRPYLNEPGLCFYLCCHVSRTNRIINKVLSG